MKPLPNVSYKVKTSHQLHLLLDSYDEFQWEHPRGMIYRPCEGDKLDDFISPTGHVPDCWVLS